MKHFLMSNKGIDYKQPALRKCWGKCASKREPYNMCKLRKSTIVSGSKTYVVVLVHQRLSRNIHLSLRLITLSLLSSKTLAFLSLHMTHHTTLGMLFQASFEDFWRSNLCQDSKNSTVLFGIHHWIPATAKKRCQICWEELQWRNEWLISSASSQGAHLLQRVMSLFWRLSRVRHFLYATI